MAEDKKICSQCNQEFRDGEFLVLHKGEAYHHIKVYDRNHTSCFIKKGLTIKDVKINTEQLMGSLERASLVTEDKSMGQTKSALRCSFEDNMLRLSSVSVSGSFNDEIIIENK